jgi:hypothetical protein
MDGLPEVKLVRADGRPSRGETKFGGRPTFLCGEIIEECCGRPMELLGQFDELDFTEAKLPGRMMAYVFICTTCYAIRSACSVPDSP